MLRKIAGLLQPKPDPAPDPGAALRAVKDRVWFYEFELPDGAVTRTNIAPEMLRIHCAGGVGTESGASRKGVPSG